MTDFPDITPPIKTDFYLKFPDASTALNEMKTAGYTQPSIAMNSDTQDFIQVDDIIRGNGDVLVHVIGIIYNFSGTFMNNTTTPQDGYHINIRKPDGQLPDNLTPYIITPKTPRNVWA